MAIPRPERGIGLTSPAGVEAPAPILVIGWENDALSQPANWFTLQDVSFDRFSDDVRDALLALWDDSLTGFLDYYPLALLEAHCQGRLGNYQEVERIYRRILFETEGNYGAYVLSRDELRTVRFALAESYLAWGDSLFRQRRGADSSTTQAREKYGLALSLFENSAIAAQIDKQVAALASIMTDYTYYQKDRPNLPGLAELTWDTTADPPMAEVIFRAKTQISRSIRVLTISDTPSDMCPTNGLNLYGSAHTI